MPRERITHDDTESTVHIGWGSGTVQIGVEVTDGRSFTFVGPVPDVVTSPTEADSHTRLWSDLDRAECNHLIRVLRRARDSAFGRDE